MNLWDLRNQYHAAKEAGISMPVNPVELEKSIALSKEKRLKEEAKEKELQRRNSLSYADIKAKQEKLVKDGVVDPNRYLAPLEAHAKATKGWSYRHAVFEKRDAEKIISKVIRKGGSATYFPCVQCGSNVARRLRKLQADKWHGKQGYKGLTCLDHLEAKYLEIYTAKTK